MRVKLQVSAGSWEVEVTEYAGQEERVPVRSYHVTGSQPVFTLSQKKEWMDLMKEKPLDLYRLLSGQYIPAIEAISKAAVDSINSLSEGEQDVPRESLKSALETEPLLCLELAGVTRDELLDSVFDAWAAELAHIPQTTLAVESLPREGARGSAAAISDWIAESAAQGALHRPGPGFYEIDIHLSQDLPQDQPVHDAAALLPNLPRAGEALAIVRARVAARARAAIPGQGT